MSTLFRFPEAIESNPSVDAWFDERSDLLGAIAQHWFSAIRNRGDDVREVLHDGRPTACVQDAAFVYVDAYTAHVNVGFFRGAELSDSSKLLQGGGKRMRHVKIRPNDEQFDEEALLQLITSAYDDMRRQIASDGNQNQ